MYEWNEDEKKIDFSHNPFSMVQGGLEALEGAADNDALLGLKAYQYDIVCNGFEIGSGAIRNHKPEIMRKAFAIAGYPEEVLEEQFGGMYRAFHFGAPPHGGMAAGVDRIVMLMVGRQESARSDAVPDESAGGGFAHGRAVRGVGAAVAGPACQAEPAEEVTPIHSFDTSERPPHPTLSPKGEG